MRNQLVLAWCVLDLSCPWGNFWILVSILILILISNLCHQAPHVFSCFGLSRKPWRPTLEASTATPRGANVVSNVLWVTPFEPSLKHFGGLWARWDFVMLKPHVFSSCWDLVRNKKTPIFACLRPRGWSGNSPIALKPRVSHVFQTFPHQTRRVFSCFE